MDTVKDAADSGEVVDLIRSPQFGNKGCGRLKKFSRTQSSVIR